MRSDGRHVPRADDQRVTLIKKNMSKTTKFDDSMYKVEAYIVSHGGTIDKSVKKTTSILLIGDCECQAYSNGTYGTKVKKAMEYNSNGCNI